MQTERLESRSVSVQTFTTESNEAQCQTAIDLLCDLDLVVT